MRKFMLFFTLFTLFLLTACSSDSPKGMVSSGGGGFDAPETVITQENKDEIGEEQKEEKIERDNEKETTVSEEDYEKKADNAMAEMSIEEKIGQMFIVPPEEFDNSGEATVVYEDYMGKKLSKYNVGGIIFFAGNIKNPAQTETLISEFQQASKTNMFIAVDEEGGIVSRIARNPNMGTTKFPSMSEIGKTNDPEKAYNVGNTTGKEIKTFGFNVNLAPVADVITNNDNYEIGERSFGTDPDIVSEMVGRYVDGLHDSGMCSALKHFPGQGSTASDTHKTKGMSYRTLNQLRSVEIMPFKKGIEEDVDFIMISHISLPNVNNDEDPASLSEEIMTDLLKKELGYKNIIISDSFQMKAVTDSYSSDKAAVMFVKAGGDIILMPENFKNAYESLLNAVEKGDISEDRINESVKKILTVKAKRGII